MLAYCEPTQDIMLDMFDIPKQTVYPRMDAQMTQKMAELVACEYSRGPIVRSQEDVELAFA